MSISLVFIISDLKRWNEEVYEHITTRTCSLASCIENVQYCNNSFFGGVENCDFGITKPNFFFIMSI